MVKLAERKPEMKLFYPKSKDEMLKIVNENNYSKFIVKLSRTQCPPCKSLKEWLEKKPFTTSIDLPIMNVNLEDQQELFDDMRKYYPIKGVPLLLLFSSEMKLIDSFSGYSQVEITSLINKNF